jgi:hypothetical protein
MISLGRIYYFIRGCLWCAGILVMRRAIFYQSSLDGEEEEFLLALCAGYE